jgi:probable rRNA maturation factor
VNIDLIAPKNLNSYHLIHRYSFLLNKTLKVTGHSKNFLVDVLITTNKVIRTFNFKYLNHDYPTDVLSFPFDINSTSSRGKKILLGQIVISYQQAFIQAKNYGHTKERELSFLFVHGLLHLLGYHHDTKTEEALMIELQDKILGKRKKI